MNMWSPYPIFKKANPEQSTNYMPISLNHQFNKVFEKITFSRLYKRLEKYELLNEHRYSFRKNFFQPLMPSGVYTKNYCRATTKIYTIVVYF